MAIGRPLPHRKTIVVTRGELDDERVEVRHDLVETIQEYKNKKEDLFYLWRGLLFISKHFLM